MASRPAPALRLPHIEPMLATAGPLPSGPGWQAEAKWDGARCAAYLEGGTVRLVGRAGTDYTARFPEVVEALAEVPGPLILDGELVIMQGGQPSFSALQGRVHRTRPASVLAGARRAPAVYVAFDLLHTDRPLLAEPYTRRRALLEDRALERPRLRVPPAWDEVTAAVAWTREHQLEGVIAKKADAVYRPGTRSRNWVKLKHLRTADVVIGGWLPGGPGGATVRAVLVGAPTGEPGRLLYAGSVGSGLTGPERRALAATLRRLDQPVSPFSVSRAGLALPRGTEVRFVQPVLQAEVEFLEITPAGHLRQPVWRGLRG
ncbi:ATP-dependent DNA ligase (plasmid) [Kitasatospora sp. NBC_01246]|uniref:ATP-dependent DNA ligase n=1 Tax=Kitasatospora sp. NBC_01246 TaxID=2903570 RepID=UPI002E2EC969|nr:ATP-dependent DNA ligase [Kitasatospora sp. NBC_01246]